MSRESLGKYEIRGRIGRGSFAEVLLAWHPVLEAPRALKVPFDQSPSMKERLEAEARVQAQLVHPHICQVYDTDEAAESFFIVMEYAPGGSLRSLAKEAPIEPGRAVGWMMQAAEALSFAHSRGVVHRDLKPDNLLLSSQGELKVADFGLARILEPTEEARTRAGTVQYMAPEQLKGQATILSDLWSLGVVFYELLSGRLPFRAESHWALASRIMAGEPEPLEAGPLELPPPLETSVRRLLERDPARRTPSAAALLEELRGLRRLLAKGPVLQASPRQKDEAPASVGPSEAATVSVYEWPQARGGPARRGSVSAELVLPLQMAWKADLGSPVVGPPVVSHGLVVCATTGGELILVEETWGREAARIPLGGSLPAAPALLGGVAYAGGYGGKLAAVSLSEHAVLWEAELGSATVSTPAAGEEALFVPLVDGRLLKLRPDGGAATGVFQAQGALASPPLLVNDMVLVGSRDNHLYAVDCQDMTERWRHPTAGWMDAGASAAEGLIVAGSHDGSVSALEPREGKLRWRARTSSWVAASPAVGDEALFALAFDGTLLALALEDGAELWRALAKGRYLGGLALAAEVLVAAGAEGVVTARRAADGAELWSAPIEGECLGGPTVAGQSLYVACREGALYAFR